MSRLRPVSRRSPDASSARSSLPARSSAHGTLRPVSEGTRHGRGERHARTRSPTAGVPRSPTPRSPMGSELARRGRGHPRHGRGVDAARGRAGGRGGGARAGCCRWSRRLPPRRRLARSRSTPRRRRWREAALEAGRGDRERRVRASLRSRTWPGSWPSAGAACCLMHMLGEPRTMQDDPRYDDVVSEVKAFLEERLAFAVGEGVAEEQDLARPRHRLRQDPGAQPRAAAPPRRDRRASGGRWWSAPRARASSASSPAAARARAAARHDRHERARARARRVGLPRARRGRGARCPRGGRRRGHGRGRPGDERRARGRASTTTSTTTRRREPVVTSRSRVSRSTHTTG